MSRSAPQPTKIALPRGEPKAPPKATTWNSYVKPINVDLTNIGDLDSQFVSGTYKSITTLLNNNFNFNFRNANGENLAFAVINNPTEELTEYQKLEIIKRLEEKGTPICSINQYNQTIAHIASKHGYFDIVKYVSDKSCGIDLVDNYGNAPIHYCVDKLVFDCGKERVFEKSNKLRREIETESDIGVITNRLIYKEILEKIRDDPETFEDQFALIMAYVDLVKFYKINDVEKIIEDKKTKYVEYVVAHRDVTKLNEETLKEFGSLYRETEIKDLKIDDNFIASERLKNDKWKREIVGQIVKVHEDMDKGLYSGTEINDGGIDKTITKYCEDWIHISFTDLANTLANEFMGINPSITNINNAVVTHNANSYGNVVLNDIGTNNIEQLERDIQFGNVDGAKQLVNEKLIELTEFLNARGNLLNGKTNFDNALDGLATDANDNANFLKTYVENAKNTITVANIDNDTVVQQKKTEFNAHVNNTNAISDNDKRNIIESFDQAFVEFRHTRDKMIFDNKLDALIVNLNNIFLPRLQNIINFINNAKNTITDNNINNNNAMTKFKADFSSVIDNSQMFDEQQKQRYIDTLNDAIVNYGNIVNVKHEAIQHFNNINNKVNEYVDDFSTLGGITLPQVFETNPNFDHTTPFYRDNIKPFMDSVDNFITIVVTNKLKQLAQPFIPKLKTLNELIQFHNEHNNTYDKFQFEKYLLQFSLYNINYNSADEKLYYIASIMSDIVFIQQFLYNGSFHHLQSMSVMINIYSYALKAIVNLIKLKNMPDTPNVKAKINYNEVYTQITNTLKHLENYVNVCNDQMACEYLLAFNEKETSEKPTMYFNRIKFQTYKSLDSTFDDGIFVKLGNIILNYKHDPDLPTPFKDHDLLTYYDEMKNYLMYFYQKDYNEFYGYTDVVYNIANPYATVDKFEHVAVDDTEYFTGYTIKGFARLPETSDIFKGTYESEFANEDSPDYTDGQYKIIQNGIGFGVKNSKQQPIISVGYINEILKKLVTKLFASLGITKLKHNYTDTVNKHFDEINTHVNTINSSPSALKTIIEQNLILIVNKSIKNMVDNQCVYLFEQLGINSIEKQTMVSITKNIEQMLYNARNKYFFDQQRNSTRNYSTINPLPNPISTIDSIRKITESQCVNDTTLSKFDQIKFNYTILDKNGNNVLNHLISQFNLDGVKNIQPKIWQIKNVTNMQGFDSIGFLNSNYNLISSAYKENNFRMRLDSYADVLNKVISMNAQYNDLLSEDEPFLQKIIYPCILLFMYKIDNPAFDISSRIIDGTYYGNIKLDYTFNWYIDDTKFIANCAELAKQYIDFDKYEDSNYNVLNVYIVEIIKHIIVNIISIEFEATVKNYFDNPTLNSDITIKPLFDEILKQSIYNKLSLKNPNNQYPDIDVLKQQLLSSIYKIIGETENEIDTNRMNVLMNYYITIAENIAFDYSVEMNNYFNDVIKLDILNKMRTIIDNAKSPDEPPTSPLA